LLFAKRAVSLLSKPHLDALLVVHVLTTTREDSANFHIVAANCAHSRLLKVHSLALLLDDPVLRLSDLSESIVVLGVSE